MPTIKVHEKALAHLSRGLYRSPASAIRELVSNAWDANATDVTISTGAPRFTLLSVRDNGDGFTRDSFERLMEGGIGNSEKRSGGEKELLYGRPILGRLGIGMLGIAQICGRFTLTSKNADGEGFRAFITLYDLIKQRLDQDDPEIVVEMTATPDEPGDADEGEPALSDTPVLQVLVGTYEFDEDFDPDEVPQGTSILTDDLHPAFVESFSDTHTRFPETWHKFITESQKVETVQQKGDYWRFIWDLSALCPVPYSDENAVPDDVIKDDQERLLAYNFRVVVDDFEIRKPIYLSGNKGGYTTARIGPVAKRPFKRDLVFHGYIAVQEGSQLKPSDLRGLMIRIKHIGVGMYDPSLLDFGSNEGPRTRWITGEIFVDTGLEDALNVDRDSFNRFHPEFRALQQHVHKVLREEVLSTVYRKIDVRSKARATERTTGRKEVLRAVLENTLGAPVQIAERPAPESVPNRQSTDRPVVQDTAQIDRNRDSVVVVPSDPTLLKASKATRDLVSAVLTLYDVAQRETSPEKRRQVFATQLANLLRGW